MANLTFTINQQHCPHIPSHPLHPTHQKYQIPGHVTLPTQVTSRLPPRPLHPFQPQVNSPLPPTKSIRSQPRSHLPAQVNSPLPPDHSPKITVTHSQLNKAEKQCFFGELCASVEELAAHKSLQHIGKGLATPKPSSPGIYGYSQGRRFINKYRHPRGNPKEDIRFEFVDQHKYDILISECLGVPVSGGLGVGTGFDMIQQKKKLHIDAHVIFGI